VRIASEDIRSRNLECNQLDDRQELTEALASVAWTVGIGVVKYADLSTNRKSTYRFSFRRMLSLIGNIVPCMRTCCTHTLGYAASCAGPWARERTRKSRGQKRGRTFLRR